MSHMERIFNFFIFCNLQHTNDVIVAKNKLYSKWHPIEHRLMNIEHWMPLMMVNDFVQIIYFINFALKSFHSYCFAMRYAIVVRSVFGVRCSVFRCCSFVSNSNNNNNCINQRSPMMSRIENVDCVPWILNFDNELIVSIE